MAEIVEMWEFEKKSCQKRGEIAEKSCQKRGEIVEKSCQKHGEIVEKSCQKRGIYTENMDFPSRDAILIKTFIDLWRRR